jgi:hypothetical protein
MDCRAGVLLGLSFFFAGCGGGAPLFHPAHVLRPGNVRVGAGLSGQIALMAFAPSPRAAPQNSEKLQELAVAPAVAPWVGGRLGIAGDNEAGLTYSGRAIRVDARHAFSFGGPALSLGLGATAVTAQGLAETTERNRVYGGGLDVPILFGLQSASDIYAVWMGPRAGIEFLAGRLSGSSQNESASVDVTARHVFAGVTAGLKAGFRHVHVALEVNYAYHRADGVFGGIALGQNQFTLTPGGALLITF